MTAMDETAKPRKPRSAFKSATIVVGGTCVLLALLEGVLRIAGVEPAFTPHHGMLRDGAPAPEVPVLVENPRFVTNDHGIWVANPVLPYTNEQGFRTPAFDEDPGERPTVAFIGDSFVWGMSAEPLENSFVDLVRNEGFRTVNFGIPGVGVVQYAAIAERYLEEIRPDAVALVFYPGNDFEYEPPIVPGHPRYYLTSEVMLSAFSPQGEPWSLEEAHASYADVFGTSFGAKARRTLLSSSVFSAAIVLATGGGGGIPHLESIVADVERVRDATEAAGADFLLLIAPVRPEYQSKYNTNAFCLEVFAPYGPQAPDGFASEYYAELPDAHFDNGGHARFADYVVEVLVARGHAPKPDDPTHVPVVPFTFSDDDMSWEYFAMSLALSPEQAERVRPLIDGIKDDFTTIFSRRPSAFELSPLEVLASALGDGGEGTVADGEAAFMAYARDHAEPVSGEAYARVFAERAEARISELSEILNDQQHVTFSRHFMDRVLDIDTGHDPLGEHIAMLMSETRLGFGTARTGDMLEEMPFAELVEHLQLDGAQSDATRDVVNELKVRFTAIFSKAAESGAPSPLEKLAELMADENIDEAGRNALFEAHARKERPDGRDKDYFAAFSQEADQIHGRFIDLLAEGQRARLPSLPVESLMKVDTGFDPFGERLGQIMAGVATEDIGELRPRENRWAGIAAALELAPDRAEEIRRLIDGLKAEYDAILRLPTASGAKAPAKHLDALRAEGTVLAPGAFLAYLQEEREAASGMAYSQLLEEAEIAVRRRIYGLLNRAQRQIFEERVAGSLTDIDTAPR